MEFKSAYYKSFEEYLVANNIDPSDIPLLAPHVIPAEEMTFGFTMFLIM